MNVVKMKLDLYKTERESLRQSFDDEIYKKYKESGTVCKPLLEHLSARLSDLDKKVEGLIQSGSDEEYEEELGEVKIYQGKISECLAAPEKKTGKHFGLPELKLPTFDGSIGKWLEFWASFTQIANYSSLEDWQKYLYLLQSTTGAAHDFVSYRSIENVNFQTAIKEFKETFGALWKLRKHYVKELIEIMKRMKTTNEYQNNLMKYFEDLRSNYCSLRQVGLATRETSIILLVMMEETLPPEILNIWSKRFDRIDWHSELKSSEEKDKEDPIFNYFLNFVKLEIKFLERSP